LSAISLPGDHGQQRQRAGDIPRRADHALIEQQQAEQVVGPIKTPLEALARPTDGSGGW
jgi:hypothetical protein